MILSISTDIDWLTKSLFFKNQNQTKNLTLVTVINDNQNIIGVDLLKNRCKPFTRGVLTCKQYIQNLAIYITYVGLQHLLLRHFLNTQNVVDLIHYSQSVKIHKRLEPIYLRHCHVEFYTLNVLQKILDSKITVLNHMGPYL